MDEELRRAVEGFVHENIGQFHARRLELIQKQALTNLLQTKNPYLFKAKNLNNGGDLIKALLAARLSSSEEGLFGQFLEALALFVASKTCDARKATSAGLDIDLVRDNVRYLIAVKSGDQWGNSNQHAHLRQNFISAVRVLKQDHYAGEIQPTLGICYGKFKTKNNGAYLHIGGQAFWELLSQDRDIYMEIIEPVGHEAARHDEAFATGLAATQNRLTGEFLKSFSRHDGTIDWLKFVELVSKNL